VTVNSYRELGSTALAAHPIGFGSYRIHLGNHEHEAALRLYLERGGNLIDTSANYGDGLSEALIGQVLRDHTREKIILVTKAGYIQGRNMELARKREFPEVVRYDEGLWHCIHPDFLEAQLQASLDRMGVPKVNIYLLHNPEYFLTERRRRGALSPGDQEEFYRRIGEAFRFLETQVDRGKIDWFGISSNNFGLPMSDDTMTSVSRCAFEAQKAGHDHHFRIVQLPMNLYEPGGALEKNNEGQTVLEYCLQRRFGVLVNRPLNAFAGNRLLRLADFIPPGQTPPGVEALHAALKPLRTHEQRIGLELQVPLMDHGIGLAGRLEHLVLQLQSPSHWEHAVGSHVILPLQSWLASCDRNYSKDMRWQAWRQDLVALITPLFDDISSILAAKEQPQSDAIRSRLYDAGYPESADTLSRMALNVLANLDGMGCVLNGVRRRRYVEDSMAVPSLPHVDGLGILRRFHATMQLEPERRTGSA
jgi:aryl-alcohol dehydrogenase-like predicted oxidoreductase